MSFKDVMVWLFARNTKPGSKYLHGDEATFRRMVKLGQVAVQTAGRLNEPPRWAKYTSSENYESCTPQTNYFEGFVGEKDPRRKVHIAVDENGRLLYVRDLDGTVLFDRSQGDTPPPGWD